EPDGPTSATNSWGAISRLMSCRPLVPSGNVTSSSRKDMADMDYDLTFGDFKVIDSAMMPTNMNINDSAEAWLSWPACCRLNTCTPKVVVPGAMSKIDTVSSLMAVTNTNTAPDMAAGMVIKPVVLNSARTGPAPEILAASSTAIGVFCSGARTACSTRAVNAQIYAPRMTHMVL